MREIDLAPLLRADADLRVIRAFGKSLFVFPLWCTILGVVALISSAVLASVIVATMAPLYVALAILCAGCLFTWLVIDGLRAIPFSLVGNRKALASFERMQWAGMTLGGGVALLIAFLLYEDHGTGIALLALASFAPALWAYWRTIGAAQRLRESSLLDLTYDPLQAADAAQKKWRKWRDLVLAISPIVHELPEEARHAAHQDFETASLNEAYAMYGLATVPSIFSRPQVVEFCIATAGNLGFANGIAAYAIVLATTTAATIFAVPFLAQGSRESAQRNALLTFEDLVAADKRPPVLFLRSFGDDSFSLRRPRQDFLSRVATGGYSPKNIDELLVEQFWWIGPPLALGAPHIEGAPYGAARTHDIGTDWRSKVREVAGAARLIVFGLGTSAGLLTEVEMILSTPDGARRTVFLLPASGATEAMEQFFAKASALGFAAPPAAAPSGRLIAFRFVEGRSALACYARRIDAFSISAALRVLSKDIGATVAQAS